jgi:choline dehydrogenase-like flavoprotein
MLSDFNHIKSPAAFEVDICILGGGAAGITIALELIDSGLSILLVESGGLEYDQATQDLYKGENVSFKDFPLETTRLRFLGGTTNHWGGMSRPLDSYDFHREYDSNHSSWPLTKADLAPYYVKAHKLCELGSYIYDDYLSELNLADDFPLLDKEQLLRPVFFQRSPPTRFGATYLDKLKQAQNVDVLLNANVKELVDSADRKKIISASLVALSGTRASVKAKQFVLAAGGLENPRILLLSRTNSEKGIGNSHDLVGRTYMDHFGAYIGKALFHKPINADSIFFREKKFMGAQLGACLAPSPKRAEKQGIGNYILLFSPGTESDLSIEMLKSIKNDIANLKWPENAISKLSKIIANADTFANLSYKNVFDTNDSLFDVSTKSSGQLCNVAINMEQTPNDNSRVTLSAETDSLGLQKIKLDWQLNEKDRQTLRTAVKELASMLGRSGKGRLRTTSNLEGNESNYTISCHHSGTTRMASDRTKGVVNSDCRVHGIENLYIAGSSVFPSIGWANPTLTIVALSIRLAETLKLTFTANENA